MKYAPIIFTLIICGCLCGQDSPAPGCGTRMPFAMGGCFGESIVKDFVLGDAPDCLKARPNNCNGGVVELDNACRGNVTLGGVTVGRHESIELVREGGAVRAARSNGNFASYSPDMDDTLSEEGYADDVRFTITYTKTKPLC